MCTSAHAQTSIVLATPLYKIFGRISSAMDLETMIISACSDEYIIFVCHDVCVLYKLPFSNLLLRARDFSSSSKACEKTPVAKSL